MIESKYLKQFQRMAAEGKDAYRLNGEFILVEELPFEEKKTKGGIILPGSEKNRDGFGQNRPTLVIVLAIGEGYYDDVTGESVPLDVAPGDIILVGGQSVKWLSYLGPIISAEGAARIGLSTASETQLKFNGAAGYQKVYELLGAEANDGQQR
jgi:co-chaperonin GroES (HSP10)